MRTNKKQEIKGVVPIPGKIVNTLKASILTSIIVPFVSHASDLKINGVIDGPLPGGLPKAIEIYIENDIADLSICGLGSANNGGGSDGQEFTFPAVAISAGQSLFIASESNTFQTFFGFAPSYVTSAANINGDDAIELFCEGNIVDTFGDINQDGTNQAWEYLDGWAKRFDNTVATSAFDISSWEFSGKNALDGESTNLSANLPYPLTGSPADDSGNGDDSGQLESPCFNCPDLDRIASQEDFNDATYYSDVLAAISNGYSLSEIKASITNAISANHKNLSYSEVWTALTETDQDPNNPLNVILLYKGTSIAKLSNGSGEQSTNPDNWNREHVWAKSHGFPNSYQEAYTDIHHLRPTDISVNSSRGNLDFDTSDNALSEAPSNRVDGDSFEPRDEVKGDVARMIFYMDTRYEGLGNDTTPNLTVVDRLTSSGEAALGKLCKLLEWHNADPVSDFETNRNNTAFEFQGNRNPYIDHPEWVSMVFDSSACNDSDNSGDNEEPNIGSTHVIFSEYIEGTSNNKALELYNLTNADIDLAAQQYRIGRFSNGGTSASNITLTGTIPAHGTFVIANSSASDAIKSLANQLSGSLSHNGDDAYVLYKSDTTVDSFGRVGEDPGSEWGSGLNSTKDNTLIRLSAVTTGDIVVNDAFDPADEWIGYETDTFGFLGQHNGSTNDDNNDDVALIGSCGEVATLISEIQGSSDSSPLDGQTLTLEAIVTANVPAIGGFFVQEELADMDDNLLTSEGLFIVSDQQPTVDTIVRVQGSVSESYGRTQLTSSAIVTDCAEQTPSIAVLTLPFSEADSAESLEGMLVKTESPLTVTDSYNLGRYGEISLSNGLLYTPTNVFSPNSPEAIALAEQHTRNHILLDDGENGSNPTSIIYPTGGLTAHNTVRLGDQVAIPSGIVDYSFSNYRIIPTAEPIFTSHNLRSTVPTIEDGNLKVASLNVLNLFNGDGNGGGFPTERGADTIEEYNRQIAKTVNAIVSIDADIIGLMEIENDGSEPNSALSKLVDHLNTATEDGKYAYVNTNGPLGTDAIAVALVYQPAKVRLINTALINEASIFNRPPLAQTFELIANNEKITVAVNHFKSKGSCSSADSLNQDQGDGQGCYNALRTEQANELIGWLDELTTVDKILVIGDLNAYAKEDPITQFENNGYTNLTTLFNGDTDYSYSYSGQLGSLDHALASPQLASKAVDAMSWHINADEPRVLDYNLEYKSQEQQQTLYSEDVFRMSDHDPLIMTFNLIPDALLGDLDGDFDIDRNDIRLLIFAIQAKQSIDLSLDFNNDGVITVIDARMMATLCTRSFCAI